METDVERSTKSFQKYQRKINVDINNKNTFSITSLILTDL